MMIVRGSRCLVAIAVTTVWLVLASTPAQAAPARAVGPTPPRLAFVDGEVSFWRQGADDWSPAQVNTPLAAGDSLYVGDAGNVEIEIGARAFVRAGSGTQLGLESLETGFLQLEVTSGHAAIDLQRMPEGQVIEVDTPNGAFTIERAGYYRVDVNDDTVFTPRRGGTATVIPAGGETTDVEGDERVVLVGAETATVRRERAPEPDEWDRWNADRMARLTERPRSAEYVPPPVAGIDDLDRYGEWRDTPSYGHVWVPRDVAPDWAPYSTGRWVWDPYYEWTWVDEQPWGWAPYHYGRWCWNDGYWGWAPGPVVARPVYAPALVAFFDSGGVSVSVGVGAPVVSWVALGWGEPVVPWWGPPAFVGRPYWGGWGGPRVVNNVVINNTTIVNVRNVNRFRNVEVRNAVIGVPRGRFGRGDGEHVRFGEDQVRNFRPMRGAVGVRPVSESLVPRSGRAARPPERIQNRRVVATRPPEDTTRRLRAAGLEPRGPARSVAPRIVRPTEGRDGGRRERDLGDRMTPPAAPGRDPGGAEDRRRGGGPKGERPPDATRGANGDQERGGGGAHDRNAPPPPPADAQRGHRAAPPDARGRERGGAEVQGGHDVTPPPPPGDDRGPANRRRGNDAGPDANDRRGGGAVRERRAVPPPPPDAGGAPSVDEGRPDRQRGRREVAPRDVPSHREAPPAVAPRHDAVESAPPAPRRQEPPADVAPPRERRGGNRDGGDAPHGRAAMPPPPAAAPPPMQAPQRQAPEPRKERHAPRPEAQPAPRPEAQPAPRPDRGARQAERRTPAKVEAPAVNPRGGGAPPADERGHKKREPRD